MSDENVVADATVTEVPVLTPTPDLSTLYAAVAHGGGKWRLVTVRQDHGKDYESVLKYFKDSEATVRLFNATGILMAAEVTRRVLENSSQARDVKYVGAIDPVLYEGPRL